MSQIQSIAPTKPSKPYPEFLSDPRLAFQALQDGVACCCRTFQPKIITSFPPPTAQRAGSTQTYCLAPVSP